MSPFILFLASDFTFMQTAPTFINLSTFHFFSPANPPINNLNIQIAPKTTIDDRNKTNAINGRTKCPLIIYKIFFNFSHNVDCPGLYSSDWDWDPTHPTIAIALVHSTQSHTAFASDMDRPIILDYSIYDLENFQLHFVLWLTCLRVGWRIVGPVTWKEHIRLYETDDFNTIRGSRVLSGRAQWFTHRANQWDRSPMELGLE